jgi:hypothetical protein
VAFVAAVTEIESKDIDTGLKQLRDHFLIGACGAECRQDFCISISQHYYPPSLLGLTLSKSLQIDA